MSAPLTPRLDPRQSSLFSDLPTAAPVEGLAGSGVEGRGAVFTRREVAEFVLDLAGYTADRPLHRLRLLEPASGGGDFLLPIIERLLAAWRAHGGSEEPTAALSGCIRAIELHEATFARMKQRVIAQLTAGGITSEAAQALADTWLLQGDFLLAELAERYDFGVGNPPYVRLERIPDVLMAAYRARYPTLFDRADLYVAFVERTLRLLADGGRLAFICADRWTKNRYGGPLRRLVAEGGYRLRAYVDMVDTPAFQSDVIAYPAITVIAREEPGPTRVARQPSLEVCALSALAAAMTAETLPETAQGVRELAHVAIRDEPWLLDSSAELTLVRGLEARFPGIEEAGCRVGIGVATGADDVFIGPYDALDVESDRKLPLAMTDDILDGTVQWRGIGVINPFAENGSLVQLESYPRLRRHLEQHRDRVAKRHCVRKSPARWYRTIDRIWPQLATTSKLLIPDIKGEAHVVYEAGRLYPHHNLYFITSEQWDLRALQAVMLSGIARLFVATYSTRMRGGYLRFQAQYLRRIRLPRWEQVPDATRQLLAAAEGDDAAARNAAVFDLYGLSATERAIVGKA
jgi:TaqI-like C-terminal specificity domain/Eco57I restriction-modification methylase